MNNLLSIGKYTLGVGDRFGHQAAAQLQACIRAAGHGVAISPTWNKSNREHNIIGSEPASVRLAADAAVDQTSWTQPYYVDADHIGLKTVDRFVHCSDFFTIDVADFIDQPAPVGAVNAFVERHVELIGRVQIAGIERPFDISRDDLEHNAGRYLVAVAEAGAVFRHIATSKGDAPFITEVSMDETNAPQTPPELLIILAAIKDEGIPIQTIAPKFSGRFNKGVDYVGDLPRFEQEFNDDVCVIAHAIHSYGLPETLKLSVHSGSDKFSIYPAIHRALVKHRCGVHVKTAGTTWLEEIIGLAEHGGAGLKLAKNIYAGALAHIDELCAPYASVINIDSALLPSATDVMSWSSEQYVRALRHNRADALYNPNLRQLLHVGFKIAAKMGADYLQMLDACEASVARNVTMNLYERHIVPLFM